MTKSKNKPAPHPSVSETVRTTIESRGMAAFKVAKLAGVPPTVVLRFMKGERGLTTPTLDKVCAALGLRLVETEDPAPDAKTE